MPAVMLVMCIPVLLVVVTSAFIVMGCCCLMRQTYGRVRTRAKICYERLGRDRLQYTERFRTFDPMPYNLNKRDRVEGYPKTGTKDRLKKRAKKEKKTFGALVIEILEQAATA